MREPPSGQMVLIVDDAPDNLAVMHDALDESGYQVLVATSGETGLQRARANSPDLILLDAMMPGMDGFEVARRLKADPATEHIPIIFMTGLTETEHVVAAFEAGGSDYVSKPIRPMEVLARMAAQLHSARMVHQARTAMDAFGHATLSVEAATGRIVWQTPLARKLMAEYFTPGCDVLPDRVQNWARQSIAARAQGQEVPPLSIIQSARRLSCSIHAPVDQSEWLFVLYEESDAALLDAMMYAFKLTVRESEVLYWVIKGKTNRDIGDILGTSPRTVNKHLEHVFEKLGVETRTAAAALVMQKVRSLAQPQSAAA